MERPAKERLIGAVVIVTVAWLLIPVFLDQGGGDGDAVVSRELALPDPERDGGTPMRRETVPLDDAPETRPADAVVEEPAVTALPVPTPPASASADDASSAPQTPATASNAAPDDRGDAAASTASPEPAAADVDTTGARAQPAADDASAQVAADEAPAGPQPAGAAASGGQLWAVQLGSFSDRDNAQRLASELRREGLPAFLSQVQSGGRTLHRVRVGPQASREEADAVAARLKAAGQPAAVVRPP